MDPFTGPASAGVTARHLIAKEIEGQDKMWGATNDRADATLGQLLNAGLAQAVAIRDTRSEHQMANRAGCFDNAKREFYPADWNGFRDYGSDVANLVVAAAFIEQEIKRLIADGASTYRAPRLAPYAGPDKPAMSSSDAGL